MSRQYRAFISYRHRPVDMAVARRLHGLIEHFRVPRALREKAGGKKLGIVFRDKDELPISMDLTGDIFTALDHTEFLIVICTPDTPKSLWVEREITYFLEHHDRSRVLAVLADGTPETSFPKVLTEVYGADGQVERIIEPLAADATGISHSQRMRKLQKESRRLFAAMIGCAYDDLVQREKKYRRKCALAIASGVLAAGTAVGLLLAAKEAQLQEKIRQEQIQQSQSLALRAQNELARGDRYAAIETAASALSGDRPYVAQAEQALSQALYAYQEPRGRLDRAIDQPGAAMQLCASQDERFVAAVSEDGTLRCFDRLEGTLLWERGPVPFYLKSSRCLRMIDRLSAVLYDNSESMLLLDAQTGEVRWELPYTQGDGYAFGKPAASEDGECFACFRMLDGGAVAAEIYRTLDGSKAGETVLAPADYAAMHGAYFSADNQWLVACFATEPAAGEWISLERELVAVDWQHGQSAALGRIRLASDYDHLDLAFTAPAQLAAVNWAIEEGRFDVMLFDLTSAQMTSGHSYNCSLESWYGENVSCLFGGKKLCYAHNQTQYVFDSQSGELIFQKSLGGQIAGGRAVDGAWMWVLEDGRVFSVREDGVSGMDLGVYTDHGIGLRMPVFTGEGAQSFVALSAEEAERILSIRRMQDASASPVGVREQSARLYDLGKNPVLLSSPSGERAVCLGFDSKEWTYDTLEGALFSGTQLVQNFSAALDYDSDFGFERLLLTEDGRIVGNRGIYEIASDTLTTPDLSDMTDGQTTTASPSLQDGKPLQAMIHRSFEANRTVLWRWLDGKALPRLECPWTDGTDSLCTGANGYVAACAGGKVYVLAPQQEQWSELCGASRIFLAEEKPLMAVLTQEEELTVYHLQSAEKLATITLAYAASALSDGLFAAGDERLVVLSRLGDQQRAELYDVSSGKLLNAVSVPWTTAYGDWHACTADGCLFLFNRRASQAQGLCFDLASGEVRATIPQMMGYLAASDQVLTAQGATLDTFRLMAFERYSAATLLQLAGH